MADYFRLRQICLVANDLPRVIGDMEAIFGVKLAYQDPHVRKYGLENALFPFGLAFVDPPYGRGLAERALTSARAGGWLTADALIVVEEAAGAAFAPPAADVKGAAE